MSGARRRAVLVGAGHAHLPILREARRFAEAGHELLLVSPGPFWYSGLATGVLGGHYPAALDRIDVARLIAGGGGRCVEGQVVRVDARTRQLHLADGGTLAFDAVSLDVGSSVVAIEGETAHSDTVFAAKPVDRLVALRDALHRRLSHGDTPRVVVAGGGVTGFEVAGNVLGLAVRAGGRPEVTVAAGGPHILRQMPPGAATRIEASLIGRGARVLRDARIVRLEGQEAFTAQGDVLPFDLFVNATGLQPPPLAGASGLPTDESGALRVDETLRAIGAPRVHGGGDCIALDGHALPKVGVHAIRQAPILLHNLLASLDATPPVRFRPQRRFLAILNLGDGTGLATRGPLWWHGRSAFWLKDRIDRRFLARYQPAA